MLHMSHVDVLPKISKPMSLIYGRVKLFFPSQSCAGQNQKELEIGQR